MHQIHLFQNQDFGSPWHETGDFYDDNYDDRGIEISNSTPILYCQKLSCMCRAAGERQPAGATNWKWVCLHKFASTETMLRALSTTKQGISILISIIWSESDNDFNCLTNKI